MINSIQLSKQIEIIKDFLNSKEFLGKAIIYDVRILLYVSGINKINFNNKTLNDYICSISCLKSCKIIIPKNLGFDLGYFYPKKGTKLLKKYENLIKNGLELDIVVVDNLIYIKYNIYKAQGIKFILDQKHNFLNTENIQKIYFKKGINYFINNFYKNFLKDTENDIGKLIKNYSADYKYLIKLIPIIKKLDIQYKNELIKYFIHKRLVDVKKMIIGYKILLYEGYNNISEISNKRLINKTYIKYIKNISIGNIKIHSGKISKVYNLKTANNFKKGNIMIAENTNPEYLNAFYNASFICVDTNSELSYAAITCSELNIPLALGAREIFLATTEKQKIKINTQQKIIYLYL